MRFIKKVESFINNSTLERSHYVIPLEIRDKYTAKEIAFIILSVLTSKELEKYDNITEVGYNNKYIDIVNKEIREKREAEEEHKSTK